MKKSDKSFTYFFGITTLAVLVVLIIVLSLISTGLLRVKKSELVIETGSITKLYDSYPLSYSEYKIVKGELGEGHKINILTKTEKINAGTYENVHEYEIVDKAGKNVTDEYDIKVIYGSICIKPRKIVIETDGGEKKYDGKALTNDNWRYVSRSLSKGHEVNVTVTGSQQEIGTSPNYCVVEVWDEDHNMVNENYDIQCEFGELSVKGSTIVVATKDKEKEYDKKPLDGGEAYIESGELMQGHKLMSNTSCRLTKVGIVDNIPNYFICDENGNDVTSAYEIITNFGQLRVTPKYVLIETASAKKTYDGDYLSKPEYVIRKGEILEGDQLNLIIATKIRTASSVDNRVTSLKIETETPDGKVDVTDNYHIEYIFGTLLITND